MVVGTFSLVQKGQTNGCNGIVAYGGGALSLVQKGQISGCSMQWMQYTVDAVGRGHSGCSGHSGHSGCSGHSGHSRHSEIVVYGSGDIVFGAKRSNQLIKRMQWNSTIRWSQHCLWSKKVKSEDAVCSGHSTQWMQ